MRTIAIANRKGGTGKTTTAVNLAAEWSRQGLNTLLIDLDTQGHAGIGVGYGEHLKGSPTIHRLFEQPETSIAELIVPTPFPRLSLIAADSGFDGLGLKWDVELLRQKLLDADIKNRFQRIVLDTPPTLDALLISALVAAEGVVVPFVPHHLAQVGVRQLARLFYLISTRYNPGLKLLGLLPIMQDKRVKLHQKVVDELSKQFGEQRILRGIRNNIRLAEAFAEGKPVSEYVAHCPGALDYYLLVNELETIDY